MSIIRLAHNAVNAKLYDAPRPARLLASSALSYKVAGAEHSLAYKQGNWDGRSSFYEFKTDTFPAGFVSHVHTVLIRAGYVVQIVRRPLPHPAGPQNPKPDDFPYDIRYDYQPQTVEELLKRGQMIAQVATGGGKSRIARIAYARIGMPTLFLTTRSVLMYQMKEGFEKHLRIRVGIMGDSEFSPIKGFNVGMVQTLAARLQKKGYEEEVSARLEAEAAAEDKKVEELVIRLNAKGKPHREIVSASQKLREKIRAARLPEEVLVREVERKVDEHNERRRKIMALMEIFKFVILEEAHEAGSNSYYDILKHCKNADYRLALTATPFMREDEEANMRLMACSGPIGIQISEKHLIDCGILARPIFKYIATPPPPKLHKMTAWQRAYKIGIVENEFRNAEIVREAERAVSHGLTVMCLVQRRDHGKTLLKMFTDKGLRSRFIFGENNQEERKAALTDLELGNVDVLIGSNILDVGIDVPSVGMVILAAGGKAEVALRQRIGRGLRAKKNGANVALIIDFEDAHNGYLKSHALQRRKIIEETPGFAENILPSGQDFDYGIFNEEKS